MTGISTHVLEASTGTPAAGVAVRLWQLEGPAGERLVAAAVTDRDGRVGDLLAGPPAPGTYRLLFETGEFYRRAGIATFYPQVLVTFTVTDAAAHHHVPLLLSPFGYSTYRGS